MVPSELEAILRVRTEVVFVLEISGQLEEGWMGAFAYLKLSRQRGGR